MSCVVLAAKALCAFILAGAVAGCALEAPGPLGPRGEAIADASLAGRWTCAAPGEADVTVTIEESPSRAYAIEGSEQGPER